MGSRGERAVVRRVVTRRFVFHTTRAPRCDDRPIAAPETARRDFVARWRFAGGSAGAVQSGISSSDESSDMAAMAAGGSRLVPQLRDADSLWDAASKLWRDVLCSDSAKCAALA